MRILLGLCLAVNAFALGQARYVATVNAQGSFPLVHNKDRRGHLRR